MCGHEEDGAGVPEWHQPAPRSGTETYPHDWEDDGDPPDWISATCATCDEAIEWDVRNLWSHSDEDVVEAIRKRSLEVVARPAADGRYYTAEARAIADRLTLLAEVDALRAQLKALRP
jgi:hypothetical protein